MLLKKVLTKPDDPIHPIIFLFEKMGMGVAKISYI